MLKSKKLKKIEELKPLSTKFKILSSRLKILTMSESIQLPTMWVPISRGLKNLAERTKYLSEFDTEFLLEDFRHIVIILKNMLIDSKIAPARLKQLSARRLPSGDEQSVEFIPLLEKLEHLLGKQTATLSEEKKLSWGEWGALANELKDLSEPELKSLVMTVMELPTELEALLIELKEVQLCAGVTDIKLLGKLERLNIWVKPPVVKLLTQGKGDG